MSLDLTVNASTVQLTGTALRGGAERHVCSRTGMPAERLVLEVTEGVLIEYPERARA